MWTSYRVDISLCLHLTVWTSHYVYISLPPQTFSALLWRVRVSDWCVLGPDALTSPLPPSLFPVITNVKAQCQHVAWSKSLHSLKHFNCISVQSVSAFMVFITTNKAFMMILTQEASYITSIWCRLIPFLLFPIPAILQSCNLIILNHPARLKLVQYIDIDLRFKREFPIWPLCRRYV